MTIDEAIRHCEEVAENYRCERDDAADINDVGTASDCQQCADEHEQLAEWLRELKTRRTQFEKICIELSELFGCPCNFSPMDEIMTEAEGCVEDCGDVNESECWRRYFETKGV